MRFVQLQSAVSFTSINDVVLWLISWGQYTFLLSISRTLLYQVLTINKSRIGAPLPEIVKEKNRVRKQERMAGEIMQLPRVMWETNPTVMQYEIGAWLAWASHLCHWKNGVFFKTWSFWEESVCRILGCSSLTLVYDGQTSSFCRNRKFLKVQEYDLSLSLVSS